MKHNQEFLDQLEDLITGHWKAIEALATELNYNKPKGQSWDSHAEKVLLKKWEADGKSPEAPESVETVLEPEAEPESEPEPAIASKAVSTPPETVQQPEETMAEAPQDKTQEEQPQAPKIPSALQIDTAPKVGKQDTETRSEFFKKIADDRKEDVDNLLCQKCQQQAHQLKGKRYCPVMDPDCQYFVK